MARHNRRWFQFSLRAILLVTTTTAVLLGSVQFHPARQQSRAVGALRKVGALVAVEPAGPAWLSKLVGEEYFVNVTECAFNGAPITDADLEHLRSLTNLQYLDLVDAQITDAGLEHLRGLTKLQHLWLSRTHVTDAGLEHLKGLSKLQYLTLDKTQVTEAGVADLRKALPNVAIGW